MSYVIPDRHELSCLQVTDSSYGSAADGRPHWPTRTGIILAVDIPGLLACLTTKGYGV